MQMIANVAVAFVALLHILFLILEMFLWTKPTGRRIFGLSAEMSKATAALAANQGLYNGFLAAGLIWGIVLGVAGFHIKIFFLGCVIVAGIYAGLTVKKSILWTQALPGACALVLVLVANN